MQTSSLSTRILHFVNTYSIWVALGSLITFSFVSVQFTKTIDWVVAVGFAIGIWFIYTFDHLLDGVKQGDKAVSVRHRKHFSQKKTILTLLVIAFTIELALCFYVDSEYYRVIFLLIVLTVIHFIINHWSSNKFKERFFLKEVFIAFVVTVGFVVVPSIKGLPSYDKIVVFFAPLFFINLSNLLLFTLYDKEIDLATNTLSAASFYTEKQLKNVITSALILGLLFVAIAVYTNFLGIPSMLLFLSMIISLFVINKNKEYFGLNDRYRFFGDLIYVYPAVILPFL